MSEEARRTARGLLCSGLRAGCSQIRSIATALAFYLLTPSLDERRGRVRSLEAQLADMSASDHEDSMPMMAAGTYSIRTSTENKHVCTSPISRATVQYVQ